MREILHGISNIQHTLANFMIRLDLQGNHMEELTEEIRGRNGIQVRLEEVSEQANDTIYSVTELKASQDKMERDQHPKRLCDQTRIQSQDTGTSNYRPENTFNGEQRCYQQ